MNGNVQTKETHTITVDSVIARVKRISPETSKLEDFKMLAVKVDRRLKNRNLKEFHALKLFLLKAQRANYPGKLNGFFEKLSRRENEFHTRLKIESDCDSFSTRVESLPESIDEKLLRYLAVSGLIVGLIGLVFFPPAILFFVAPMGYLFSKSEKPWRKYIKSISD